MVAGCLAAVLAMALTAGAQDEKKRKGGALPGLPSVADLKTKCGWDDEQAKAAEKIVNEDYKDKIAEAQKKIKEAAEADKKSAVKEAGALRTEILGKLKEVCKDDEQKKKFDEATAPPKKKKDAANP
jgi:hypothetical protein